jgi:hypothetical protein
MIANKAIYDEDVALFSESEIALFEGFIAAPYTSFTFGESFFDYWSIVAPMLTYKHRRMLIRHYTFHFMRHEKYKFLKKEKNCYLSIKKFFDILINTFDAKFYDFIINNTPSYYAFEFMQINKFRNYIKKCKTKTAEDLQFFANWEYTRNNQNENNELNELAVHWHYNCNVKYINQRIAHTKPCILSHSTLLREFFPFDKHNYIRSNALELYKYNGDSFWKDVFRQCISLQLKFKLYLKKSLINDVLRPLLSLMKDINYITIYHALFKNVDIIFSDDYRLFCQKNHKSVILMYQRASLETKGLISFATLKYLCQSYYVNIPLSIDVVILKEHNRSFYWGFTKKQYTYIVENKYNPYNCRACDVMNDGTIVHGQIVENEMTYTSKIARDDEMMQFCDSWTFSFTFGMTFFAVSRELKNKLQKTIENFAEIELYRGMKFIDEHHYIKFLSQNGFATNTFNSWSPNQEVAMAYAISNGKGNDVAYNYSVLLKRKFNRNELLLYFRNFVDGDHHTDEYIAMPGNYRDVEITILD